MEQHPQRLGATAIKHRLQCGIPDIIKCLQEENIQIWVLTGDSREHLLCLPATVQGHALSGGGGGGDTFDSGSLLGKQK